MMMRAISSHQCQVIFFALAVLFLIDAVYINVFIPWNKPIKTKTNDLGVPVQTTKKDIRSMSNFVLDAKLPFVPSQKRTPTEEPTIPHIIHQTWNSEHIPKMYHKWIRTWHEHNPDWEYRLWTLPEIKRFVHAEYPDLANIYDVYISDIFRFDMMRYLVLYKFGGIYMDLDMECLKPLDNWTYGYQCIISEETYAHPFVVRQTDPPANIVNGFIATKPGHPLLKLAIDSLAEFAGNYLGDYLHATGPFFFNAVLQRHIANNNGVLKDVTIVPPKYFFPTFDPNESDLIARRCFPGQLDLLDVTGQKTCEELNLIFQQRRPDVLSYTDHHWVHAYLFTDDWRTKDTKTIQEIIPNAIRNM